MSWTRRARPLLGTLVEIGVPQGHEATPGFAALAEVQQRLSVFAPHSDIARFNALPAGGHITVAHDTAALLAFAQQLQQRSHGTFDISIGTGPEAWTLLGCCLHKHATDVALDLGGIGKGHAVDRAVQALQANGVSHGWVNAGGDLRVFGDVELPVRLRDEARGGGADFMHLADGALATSHYDAHSRCRLHGAATRTAAAHVSVAAPDCRWADALTKLVALQRGPASGWLAGLLDDAQATAWWH